MSILRVVLSALAVWRLTHLLHFEDGPFQVLKKLRGLLRRLSLSGFLDCFVCLSLWVAVPFGCALGSSSAEIVLLVFGLSAAAILIDRAVGIPEAEDAAVEERYVEELDRWILDGPWTTAGQRLSIEPIGGTPRTGPLRRSA